MYYIMAVNPLHVPAIADAHISNPLFPPWLDPSVNTIITAHHFPFPPRAPSDLSCRYCNCPGIQNLSMVALISQHCSTAQHMLSSSNSHFFFEAGHRNAFIYGMSITGMPANNTSIVASALFYPAETITYEALQCRTS